jgi:membrane protease YdiL (CAAX protease family)
MVKLDNKYPVRGSTLAVIVPVCIMLLFEYFLFRIKIFSFIYQYSITLLILVLLACFYDRGLITRDRLLTFELSRVKWIIVFAPLALLFAVAYLPGRFFREIPVLNNLFRTGFSGSNGEFFLLMLIVIPVIEEIFFRGFLQFNLMGIMNAKAGYVTASIIYAGFFIFADSRWMMLVFLVVGLCQGLIYMLNRSILLNIVIHLLLVILMIVYHF